jgi:hypothetical protein
LRSSYQRKSELAFPFQVLKHMASMPKESSMNVQTTTAAYRPTIAEARKAACVAKAFNRPLAQIFLQRLAEEETAQRLAAAAKARLAATRPAHRIAYDGGSRGARPASAAVPRRLDPCRRNVGS